MSEREFYISIIPDVAELIVYLKRLSREEQGQVKSEMIKGCESRQQAFEFMKKLWIVIEMQLKEESAV